MLRRQKLLPHFLVRLKKVHPLILRSSTQNMKGCVLTLQLYIVVIVALVSSTAIDAGGDFSQFHKIYINPDGEDNVTCLSANNDSFPCATLGYAFNKTNDSTAYILQTSSSAEFSVSEDAEFANLTNLAFIGETVNITIHCYGEGAGFAFINVSEIKFSQLSFKHCAAKRISTSKNLITGSFYTFQVALYFYLGGNVNMSGVEVMHSPNAVGVVMYNVVGVNVIENSIFSNNSVNGSHAGGGGFYIEFTFCQPGNSNCTDDSEVVPITNTNYSFVSSIFENNTANNGIGFSSLYITPHKSNHQSIGRGGGLCVYFKGKAKSNTLKVRNCSFINNVAQWGGGVMLEFHDDTVRNKVSFSNCTFRQNRCNYTFDNGTGGGGMRLGHYVFNLNQPSLKMGNFIELDYCNFIDNYAMYGGGLSISPASEVYHSIWVGKIEIKNARFVGNLAKFGSGVHLSRYSFSTKGTMLNIIMGNLTVCNNSVNYFNLLNWKSSYTIGIGAIYIVQVDVKFTGVFSISHNNGTGLAAAGSSLDFTNSRVTFEGNTGYMGGAIALLGTSHIVINNFTSMNFKLNTAKVSGGAWYVRYVEMDHLQTFFSCFIRHSQPFLTPDDWGANFTFADNAGYSGRRPNSIHSTTTLPCSWAGGVIYKYDRNKTFCWHNWNYYRNGSKGNCLDEISTEPARIDFDYKTGMTYVEAIPGHEFKLPLRVTDDYGKSLTGSTVFSSTINETEVKGSEYFWGGTASIQGNASNVSLMLESLGDLTWKTEVAVHLRPCSPGRRGTDCSCSNFKLEYGGIITCDPNSYAVKMRDEHWIGQLNGEYVAGLCPPGFCSKSIDSFIVLPNSTELVEAAVCEDNRAGVLCGWCMNGFGHAVNSISFDCVKCNSTDKAVNIASPLDQLMASFSSAK